MARGLNPAWSLAESRLQLRVGVVIFVAAVQRVLDELGAILKQIRAKLPACPREIMQGIQIELAGKLPNYTVVLLWLADHRGAEHVLAVGSGSRITAEGCRKPIDVRVWPLVCCFRMFLLRCGKQTVYLQWLHIWDTGC